MNVESLRRVLGLSPLEAKVFATTVLLGQASIQQIARKSGVKRTSIYNFLGRLTDRRLLIETKKGKRSVYSAAHPEQIRKMFQDDLAEVERQLSALAALHAQSRKRPRVTFYDGLEGIRELYEDTLREKEPIVAWTDYEHLFSVMGRYLSRYPKERAKRGISFRSIVRDSKKSREVIKRNKQELRKTKVLRTQDLRTEINVYGDKVAIMSFRKEHPLAVLIEDRDIANTLKTIWQEMWDRIDPESEGYGSRAGS